MPSLAIPTVGEQLRELERQVDALLEVPGFGVPATARIVLRSASSLLMAARHLVEDQDQGREDT